MGHVRPLFSTGQTVDIEAIVQLSHPVGGMSHSNKDRRRDWNESLDFAQGDLERLNFLAHFFQGIESAGFIAPQ